MMVLTPKGLLALGELNDRGQRRQQIESIALCCYENPTQHLVMVLGKSWQNYKPGWLPRMLPLVTTFTVPLQFVKNSA